MKAHRMAASMFGTEVKYTKRYKLGQLAGGRARHFMLMSPTPHNGNDADFELFMGLLDADRFEGRPREGARKVDVSDLILLRDPFRREIASHRRLGGEVDEVSGKAVVLGDGDRGVVVRRQGFQPFSRLRPTEEFLHPLHFLVVGGCPSNQGAGDATLRFFGIATRLSMKRRNKYSTT